MRVSNDYNIFLIFDKMSVEASVYEVYNPAVLGTVKVSTYKDHI